MSLPTNDASFGDGRTVARSLLASLDFRLRHACDDAPDGFADDRIAPGARTPREMLQHLADLMDKALGTFGHDAPTPEGHPSLGDWTAARRRVHDRIARLDRALRDEGARPGRLDPQAMVRGPLADALTHAGQLVLLRRCAGAPVARVSYPRVAMPAPAENEP